ncbi:MAG: peptidylprolyl isomerase, partial [Flavobacteriaceae bacterium]|nr:peptidylprolyl isomerase [Flavobacteriaceae bacterium]
MKLKFKIILLFFLGMTISNAQTKKASTSKKKLATTNVAKAEVKPTNVNPNEGIFAEIETTKGKIVIQLEYKKTP